MRNCVYASVLHPSVTHAHVNYYDSMYERRIHGAVASAIVAFRFLAMSTQVKRQRSSSDGEDSVDDNHIRAGLQDSFRRMSTQSDIAQLLVEKRILKRKTKSLAAKNAEMEEEVLAMAATHDEMVETLKRSEHTIQSASNHLDYIQGETATEMREHRRLMECIRSATDAKNKIDCEIADGSGHWQQWKRNTTKQESDAGYWHGEVNVARSAYVKLETEVIYSRVFLTFFHCFVKNCATSLRIKIVFKNI